MISAGESFEYNWRNIITYVLSLISKYFANYGSSLSVCNEAGQVTPKGQTRS